ncbi:hypothetical protein GCK72_019391 [Caenorhabditis remanei]|uniref:Glycosyltransferase family 92 protein n=1 Tax=Caenorhabditis remanei TaxID=31234 RepID=A0A6A5GDM9_CAERE|nr:hypothetical protein GCK72_019391 [Caenorhabditis remanei]KAF1752836.1 hypothetical protein GCK72_019391 [Caenorhabditis remanei]
MNKWFYIILTYIVVLLLVFEKAPHAPVFSSRIPMEQNRTSVENGPLTSTTPAFSSSSSDSYLMDRTDRFEWYKQQMYRDMKINESKIATNISTLYAYEFEHEIAVTTTSRDRMGYRLYCRYVDENDMEIGEPFESFTYPEYIVACKKKLGTRKIGLNPRYELSMCVATIHGSEPKWLLFIEMIEHYKLQGVQHFYLHIHNTSTYDLKVINDYIRTGELEVHYLIERDYRIDKHWHMVNVADCLIWSRLESKWTIFGDLDERILMTNYTESILDYVREVKDESIGSLQFRQQWILKTELMPEKYQGDKQIIEWMPTHRWHNSTGIGSPGHAVKCIIDSSKVFNMFIHNVIQFFPKQNGSYGEVGIKPEEGLIRHYRDQSLGNWGVKWLKETFKYGPLRNTDYPENLIGKLTENVKKRAKYVYDNKYDD